jgi:hypothetical protein
MRLLAAAGAILFGLGVNAASAEEIDPAVSSVDSLMCSGAHSTYDLDLVGYSTVAYSRYYSASAEVDAVAAGLLLDLRLAHQKHSK